MVFFIFEVQIRPFDEPFRQAVFAKKSCPVERGLSEESAQVWPRSCLQQPDPHLLSPETCSADKGRVALPAVFAVPLEIKIRAGGNKGIDQRQLFALCQCATEEHVGDKVERMRVDARVLSPVNQPVSTRRVLRKKPAKCGGIAGLNGCLHVHVICHWHAIDGYGASTREAGTQEEATLAPGWH